MSPERTPEIASDRFGEAADCSSNSDGRSALLRCVWRVTVLIALALLLGGQLLGGIEYYHAARLRRLGADVKFGPKGGYFVTLPPGSAVTDFLRHGATALDYLSRRYHTTLELDGTQVSDSDLHFLELVHGEIFISLKSTAVTDAAIQTLCRMERLSGVDVSGSPVSDEAVSAIRKAKH